MTGRFARGGTRPARRRCFGAVLLALSALTAATACSGGGGSDRSADGDEPRASTTEGTPTRGGTLRIGIIGEASGWDPINSLWTIPNHFVASAVFDPLAHIDENGDLVPFLAATIDHSDDYRTWTIGLRDGVHFHDGTVLDAEALKWNLDTRLNSMLNSFLFEPVSDVTIVDDLTVEVTMDQPWSAFDHLLTQQSGYVAAPSMYEQEKPADNPIGTGPYVFDAWQRDVRWRGTRNDDYWQDGKPYPDAIEFLVLPESDARINGLRTNEIDLLHTYTVGDITAMREEGKWGIVTDGKGEEAFVQLNAMAPPLDDLRLRQALVLATDAERIDSTLGGGVRELATQPFSKGERWYVEDHGYPAPDAAAAEALVAEVTSELGHPPRLTLTAIAEEDNLAVQQLLTDMWEGVGFEIEAETVEQSAFVPQLVGGKFQAALMANYGLTDPDFAHIFWHSKNVKPIGKGATNFAHIADDELDAALDEGRQAGDPDVRKAAYATVVRRLNATAGHVWLNHTLWALIASPKVRGLQSAEIEGFGRVDSKAWIADLWLEG